MWYLWYFKLSVGSYVRVPDMHGFNSNRLAQCAASSYRAIFSCSVIVLPY